MFQENLENFCNFCAQTNGNSPVCAQNELSQFSLCNQIRFGIIKTKTSLTKPQTAVKNEFNDVNLYKQYRSVDFKWYNNYQCYYRIHWQIKGVQYKLVGSLFL